MQESDTDFKAYFEEINREAKEREEAKKTKKKPSPEFVEGQSPEPVRHAQGKLSRREPQKHGKTKAAESVDHLTELHKLQGVLLTKLKKQV